MVNCRDLRCFLQRKHLKSLQILYGELQRFKVLPLEENVLDPRLKKKRAGSHEHDQQGCWPYLWTVPVELSKVVINRVKGKYLS